GGTVRARAGAPASANGAGPASLCRDRTGWGRNRWLGGSARFHAAPAARRFGAAGTGLSGARGRTGCW
ncbi:hypothetical protein ABTK24_19165, partial [Acinetobacter baumannii]